MNPPLTLAELQARIRACRRCLDAGYEITPGAVVSGTAGAEVMLIGQAPGITEAQVKRPFNASSGKRLFSWLGAAGWEEDEFRQRHYMSAVTKCYPGRNTSGRGDRVPTPAEQALCRPFLEAEIALVQPKLIILVGGLALKLFFPASTRLTDIVGKAVYFPPETLQNPVKFDLVGAEILDGFDPSKTRNGRWMVPLPHPSGANLWLNQPAHQALVDQAIAILGEIRAAWEL